MIYCDFTDKEFKIAVTKKLNKLQENSERQVGEIRNKIRDQNEFFTTEIEIIKKKTKPNSGAEEISE